MKHSWQVTLLFVLFFLVSHILGLFLIGNSVSFSTDAKGVSIISFKDTFVGEHPVMSDLESIIYLVVGITIGTLVLLFFAKKKKTSWWRIWFLIASWLAMTVSIQALFNSSTILLSVLAAFLALWKVYKPNVVIHNFTEVLIYTGITLIFVPMFSVLSMFIVLILISIYDAYAVWKSKHMVTLATFTRDANLFPGFAVKYSLDDSKERNKKTEESTQFTAGRTQLADNSSQFTASRTRQTAHSSWSADNRRLSNSRVGILGGGDVVFPLLFSGVSLIGLLKKGVSFEGAFSFALVISFCATLSLFLLFYFSKKDRFYPAMPFLTAGTFFGYFLALILF